MWSDYLNQSPLEGIDFLKSCEHIARRSCSTLLTLYDSAESLHWKCQSARIGFWGDSILKCWRVDRISLDIFMLV